MTATWGSKPHIINRLQITDENTELTHGKFYSLEERYNVFIPIVWGDKIEKLEQTELEEVKKHFAEDESVTLVYAEVGFEDVGVMPSVDWERHTFYVIQANHPITMAMVLAIAFAITIIIGGTIIAYGFYRLEVSGAEWAGGLGGVIMFIAVLVAVVFILPKLFGKAKG